MGVLIVVEYPEWLANIVPVPKTKGNTSSNKGGDIHETKSQEKNRNRDYLSHYRPVDGDRGECITAIRSLILSLRSDQS